MDQLEAQQVLDQQHQYNKVIDDLGKAIEADPNYIDAIYKRAQVYELVGKHALAERDLARVKELSYRTNQK